MNHIAKYENYNSTHVWKYPSKISPSKLTSLSCFQIRSQDLVQAYIARAKAVQPVTNAIVYDNFDAALKQAVQADQQLDAMSADQRVLVGGWAGLGWTCGGLLFCQRIWPCFDPDAMPPNILTSLDIFWDFLGKVENF